MNEYNAKVWILLFVIILVFLIMISALALCLFKVIYRHLEDEFEERLNEEREVVETRLVMLLFAE